MRKFALVMSLFCYFMQGISFGLIISRALGIC